MNDALRVKNHERRYLSRPARNALLTAHVIVSVGLLGDSAGFLAVAIRAGRANNTDAIIGLVNVLSMFARLFGIPLSLGTILSGIALGLGTPWGVFRYPWLITKLLLIVSVMFVGALVIGPALVATLQHGSDNTSRLIAAASYDVLALSAATALSVFKPGKPIPSRTRK